jgi:DNA-directed RNA polymerase III subunit RPC6
MASSSQSGAAAQGIDITALKTNIYDACAGVAAQNSKMVFRQASILELDQIPNNDVLVLLQVTQALVDEKLFKIVHDSDGMGWRLRSVEEAKKYASLSSFQKDRRS